MRHVASPQRNASWFSLGSLRGKLQLFALALVAVPGALLGVIALVEARRSLEQAIGRQLVHVADETLDELAVAVGEARRELAGWGRQDLMRDVLIGDIDKRVSRFLRAAVESGSTYLELSCTDRTGVIVSSSDPARIGRTLRTDEARAALGGAGAEGPLVESGGGRVAIALTAPIPDPERADAPPIGVLAGEYDWRQAVRHVDRIRQRLLVHGLGVDLLVLDGTRRIVGESWREGVGTAEVAAVRARAGDIGREIGDGRERGVVRTVQSLIGFERRRTGPLDLLVLVLEPLDDALLPVRRLQRGLGLLLGGVLLGGLALATVWAARLSRPLRELTQATRDLGRPGATPPTVPVRSRDEIGELATAFNTMGAALDRAQDDLLAAAKVALAGEMAAGIAHEVRTPLGILRSSAQLLARLVPPDQPRGRELVDMIVGEVDRIDRVVAGLLELARPREPHLEAVPLGPILQRALDFTDAQAREKGVTVTRSLDPTAGAAFCDPEQVYHVALNLVVNAIQVLPSGGHLSVRTLPRRNGYVGFEVTDDGPGIAPEIRERVFTPFVSARPGGTGLGLALVQRMVQSHHGVLALETEPGRGTTFRVELPVAGAPA